MDSSFFLTTVAAAIGLFILTTVAAAIGLFTLLRKLRLHQDDNREKDSSSSSPSSSLSPSPVPPPSSSRIWTHHVFPSFRGEDVRKDFLSHIQMEFQRKGITPFIDNEIKRRDDIGPELIRAIRGSKIAIILLSRNYASSKWCLDELVEIMKCREELGQTVMAIFYRVDPSDVKKLAGDFGRVFKKTCAGRTKENIERWRQALAKVATIAGYHSSNWDNEAAMIKKIATDISDMLNNFTPSNDFDGLVGMGAHLEKMEPLLCLGSDEVRMIGIWGPPGIGKTTIARVAYSKLSNNFQLSVFMDDLKANYTRLCSDDYSLKLQLQQQFMSQITNQKDMVVSHLGVASNRLKDKKVLVVLDGVDQSVQLEAMAKETWWFGPGSRIIITAQDQKLFRAHGVNLIYKVNFPTDDEALQIFCTYSFGQKSPKDGFEELAREVTRLAGELPLGLRVMGSYFRGMSKQEWTNSLPRLKTSLDSDIRSILKFSYDALDDEDKDLFLHIACFFNSQEIHKVEEHLAKKFLEVRQRLNVLAEKSLISIDSGVITMHSLLEKLGREIVCKQSIHEPRLRQFLWEETEIFEVLTGDTTVSGSKSVIGIKLKYNTEGEKIEISEKAFEGMSNLQFLKVSGYSHPLQLTRGLNYISHKLRFLQWTHFPMTCLPSILNLEFLVELIMHTSKLEKLWEGTKPLRCLKWMDLSYSENLKELPDLSTATNLELDLSNCSSLIKLPYLNGNSLEKLYIGGCSSLVEFPSFIENAVSLRKLDLTSYPNLLELPSYVGNATNLDELYLSNCLDLVELPLSLGNLQKLKKLVLKGCSKLEVFPTNFNVESLEILCLAGCSSLDLGGCSTIGNVPSLRMLNLRSLPQLLDLPSFIGNAINLYYLDLSGCSNLVELPVFIGNLQKLYMLGLEGCSKLEFLPTNINLESLSWLNLRDCSMLKCFPQISTNIRDLDLTGTAIEQVPPSIRSWPRLEDLTMSYFENLKEFPHALERITELCLTDTDIQELPPWVKQISCLNSFVLKGCRKLVSIPPISDSIRFLDASDCESLEILECSFHNQISRLNFANCFKLNQEARDLIIQNSREAVLPGGQVPAYFTHRATGGGPLSIKLNEKPLPKSLRFKACILLVDKGDHDACSKEKSTEVFAMYKNRHHRLYPALAQHLYTFEVEKEVTSSELLFEFKLESDDVWKIGECGIVQHLEVP
ncbi:disease resistance protein TAO1 isoform X1 [Brassica rapa]|uniref:disease resistance protein TAO1 isoform X1 n=1 Tax=Brassica campestris TaxID=3711 RepID=UPI00142D8D29|nr:disease resistance protein TAO1 isoform X1 [Brassica rapa]